VSYQSRIAQLEHRRSVLIAQAAEQREALAGSVEPWRRPLAIADRGVAVARFFKRYPAFLAAAAVVLLLLKPGPSFRWGKRAFLAWRAWRSFVRPESIR
jgi:uncharacterized MAPEG superfamily protein